MNKFAPIPGTITCRKSLDSRREGETAPENFKSLMESEKEDPRHIAADANTGPRLITRREYFISAPSRLGKILVQALRIAEQFRNEEKK